MGFSSVTSEALQLKLRQLLPSQQGFGTDISASDTIIPIIDLTAAAEGSDVRADLQSAIAFGSQTATAVYDTTSTVATGTGFFRLVGAIGIGGNGGTGGTANLTMTDGATTSIIYSFNSISHAAGQDSTQQVLFDFIVFLRSGDSVTGTTNAQAIMNVTSRQIADNNGTLVQPVGFTPQ